jgi:hypothetical protein
MSAELPEVGVRIWPVEVVEVNFPPVSPEDFGVVDLLIGEWLK